MLFYLAAVPGRAHFSHPEPDAAIDLGIGKAVSLRPGGEDGVESPVILIWERLIVISSPVFVLSSPCSLAFTL